MYKGFPRANSPYDLITRYADTERDLLAGTIVEFIGKTSVFVTCMFLLRVLQLAMIPNVIEIGLVSLLTAGYCYSIRSYLEAFVRAVTSYGLVGLFAMSMGMFALLMIAIII